MLANAHIIIFIDYRLVLLKLSVAPVLNSLLLTNFHGYQDSRCDGDFRFYSVAAAIFKSTNLKG